MKTILLRIEANRAKEEWFLFLHAQFVKDNKVYVLIEDKRAMAKQSRLVDFALYIESRYNLAGNVEYSNSFEIVKPQELEQICLSCIIDLCIDTQKRIDTIKVPIFSVLYRGARLGKLPYIGLMEHLYNEPTIDISLIRLYNGNYEVVNYAKYNGHWSSLKSSSLVYYSLYAFLNKNIWRESAKTCNPISNDENPKSIGIMDSFKYFGSSFKNFSLKMLDIVTNRLFHASGGQEWTVFIGEGSFLKSDVSKLKPLILPKGEFWADPFLFKKDGELYLFFEKFPYTTNKGIISCTKIVDGKPTEVIAVLDKPYHLSYPNIFEEDGEIYMMPECSAAKHLELYRCIEFPSKWELYSTMLEGESVADSVYYKDSDGNRWIFTSKESPKVVSHCNELWAYRVDSLKFEHVESHHQNPIIVNSKVARNGGTIYRENGHVYRASQDNSFEMYGKGVCVSEIMKLNLDEYKEEVVKRIDSNDIPMIIGMHHMNQIDGWFVIDGRYK